MIYNPGYKDFEQQITVDQNMKLGLVMTKILF
ncbi:hypothetical protein [Chryseobacterium culicis]|nr:hypothetical protein [Chryseobacterium culicis]